MDEPYNFKPGERVTSSIMGYYYGVPGTIIGESLANLEGKRSYRIRLDSGRIISLRYDLIRRLEPDLEADLWMDPGEDPEEEE